MKLDADLVSLLRSHGSLMGDHAAKEIEGLRAYVAQLEDTLRHATECCVAFQSGGQFNHLMRPGEPVFNGVPRLVAKLSN